MKGESLRIKGVLPVFAMDAKLCNMIVLYLPQSQFRKFRRTVHFTFSTEIANRHFIETGH